mmetsp:Transcript_3960/g.5117  ORF Transcript_3960/g.5117 Transcript_3960/m.5117 type:complete len:226 (+) Transcript_3960:332-1009(+)
MLTTLSIRNFEKSQTLRSRTDSKLATLTQNMRTHPFQKTKPPSIFPSMYPPPLHTQLQSSSLPTPSSPPRKRYPQRPLRIPPTQSPAIRHTLASQPSTVRRLLPKKHHPLHPPPRSLLRQSLARNHQTPHPIRTRRRPPHEPHRMDALTPALLGHGRRQRDAASGSRERINHCEAIARRERRRRRLFGMGLVRIASSPADGAHAGSDRLDAAPFGVLGQRLAVVD